MPPGERRDLKSPAEPDRGEAAGDIGCGRTEFSPSGRSRGSYIWCFRDTSARRLSWDGGSGGLGVTRTESLNQSVLKNHPCDRKPPCQPDHGTGCHVQSLSLSTPAMFFLQGEHCSRLRSTLCPAGPQQLPPARPPQSRTEARTVLEALSRRSRACSVQGAEFL